MIKMGKVKKKRKEYEVRQMLNDVNTFSIMDIFLPKTGIVVSRFAECLFSLNAQLVRRYAFYVIGRIEFDPT